VDASHGGDERGAALTDQLPEKDVTLAYARRLRQELQNRGLPTLVLRDGDSMLTLDQRANMANAAHPAIYIALHASRMGSGVRLYTAMIPVGGDNSGPFLDWSTAQAAYLPHSQAAAASLATGLERKQIPARVLIAPLRPLNNLALTALAVEVAPPVTGIYDLNSPFYQQLVASALADQLNTLRSQLEAWR
jgi:N-acetylmuramoyl-L-alanine amidase